MPADVRTDVVGRATAGVPTDHAPDGSHLIEPYAVVNRVDGLERGAYVWRGGELRLLREGDFRVDAAFLCLDQRLGLAATVSLMSDVRATLKRIGARGYRAAQLEAGIVEGEDVPGSVGAPLRRHGARVVRRRGGAVPRAGRPRARAACWSSRWATARACFRAER